MTTQEFIFDTPLYQWVEDDTETIVSELIRNVSISANDVLFEGYNPIRKVDSTYHVYRGLTTRNNMEVRIGGILDKLWDRDDVWHVTLECKRYEDKLHLMLLLRAKDHAIMKVGQYPSVADLHIGKVKRYANVLNKEDAREYTKAIGLAANGVGIGSFVYLRRIFEKLISKCSERAIEDGVISVEEFGHLRMDEKIGAIRSYLPDVLFDIKNVYGILSKGIHELSDQECLSYFDVMRIGIELILDELLEQKQKTKRKNDALKAIETIKGTLKK